MREGFRLQRLRLVCHYFSSVRVPGVGWSVTGCGVSARPNPNVSLLARPQGTLVRVTGFALPRPTSGAQKGRVRGTTKGIGSNMHGVRTVSPSPKTKKNKKRSFVVHSNGARGHHIALKPAIPSLHALRSFACSVSSLGLYPRHYLLGHLNLRREDPASCMLQRDRLSACFARLDPRWDARHRPAPVQVTGWYDPPQQETSAPKNQCPRLKVCTCFCLFLQC